MSHPAIIQISIKLTGYASPEDASNAAQHLPGQWWPRPDGFYYAVRSVDRCEVSQAADGQHYEARVLTTAERAQTQQVHDYRPARTPRLVSRELAVRMLLLAALLAIGQTFVAH